MKFREIFRFELAYQFRRLSTWVYFIALFGFGFLILRAGTPADDVFLNSPHFVAFFTVMGGVIWLLLAGSVAGDAAARDIETGMHPLTYTAPVSKIDYLGGRFLAAFTINASMLLALQAGILLSLLLPRSRPELVGPHQPLTYLTAYFLIALPNGLVATAIQFAAALGQRRAIAGYLASVLLLVVSQLVGTTVAQLFRLWELAKLIDLIGLVNIVREMEELTPLEINTRPIALEGMFLANRVVWIGIALGALAFTYRRFQFGHPGAQASLLRFGVRQRLPRRGLGEGRDTATTVNTRIATPHVQRTFGFATYARQTLALAWTSFRTIARSRTGLTVVGVMALGSALFASDWFRFLEAIPLLPRTEEVIAFYTPALGSFRTIWVVIPLLIVFYAGELIWQERDTGVSEIVDTSPVPEWVLFLSQFLGLGLVIFVWMVFFMAAGMLIQVELGYPEFNIGLYLKALFGFQLAEYLLFALLVLVLHAVVDQKYLGYVAALTALGFIMFASWLGIEHKLLIYGSDPGWSYSPMRGFGPSVGPWLWFKLYWASWALLLAAAARLFLARGKEGGLGVRLRMAQRRFTRATASVVAAAVALVVAVGGFIFYNTNVLNAYRPAADILERRAEYERRYGQYERILQPRLTGTNLHVEIYPARREMEIRGSYRLVNDGATAIDSIHVAVRWDVEADVVGFDRPATRVVDDREFGHRIYALATPLAPGDAVRLDFAVHVSPRGFRNTGADPSVVANGTYLKNLDWLPVVGYQAVRELSSASDRRRHGLPPRPEIPSLYDTAAPRERPDGRPIDFEAVVGTEEDQTAIAPGMLRRTWTVGGRRYFHYATDVRIGNEYAIFSANYALHEAQWTGSGRAVSIQIFHHPAHTQHLERMVRSAQAALTYYTQWFGPYPFRHVRLIEHPGPGRGMHADGNTIDYMEGFSLLNPRIDRGDVDLPYHIVAHEVAHQWWGTELAPAYVEGAGVLVESLATYSAMQVGEATLGAEHLRRYLRFLRLEHQVPRSPAMPPLLQAADSFLYYRKGPLALYALGEYIGQERVRDALRRLLEKHGSRVSPLPTTLDLYRELMAVTPESYQALLHDLFAANTFWELETREASAAQSASGEWQLTLNVRARKLVIDTQGIETELPMDDWVEVGVYGDGEPYVQKHRIRSGTQTITITVPSKPTRAGIDPRNLLVDWETGDNVEAVRVEN